MRRSYTRRALLGSAAILGGGAIGGCISPAGTAGDSGDEDHGTNHTDLHSHDQRSHQEDEPPNPGDEDTGTDDSGDEDHADSGQADDAEDEAVLSRTFDDFEDLTQWRLVDGEIAANAERFMVGSQSAELTVTEAETRSILHQSHDDPIDLTRQGFQLAARAEGRHIRPRIMVYDDAGNRMDFRTFIDEGLSFQYFDFGIMDATEGPDLTAVEEFRLFTQIGSDASARIWVDDLRLVERPDPGIISIHFDDTLETDYTRALPILDEHDIVASTFINPGYTGRTVGGSPRLSIEQLEALYDAGWDVCNHGMNHDNLATLAPSAQETEIVEAREWLLEHGFERGAEYFAYPFHAYNQHTIDLVSKHHELGFAGGYPAVGPAANPYLIHRARSDPSAEQAIDDIQLTATYGGITILFYHELTDTMRAEFEETVSYLSAQEEAGNIAVMSASELGDGHVDPATHDARPRE